MGLSGTPVVFLQRARQTGKSTPARELIAPCLDAAYMTFDDAAAMAAAARDPEGFVSGLPARALIDRVQRVPGMLVAIKAAVDRDRRAGRFLLTGSADVLLLPKAAESLAGRMQLHTLWPFSQGELEGRTERFPDALLADEFPRSDTGGRKAGKAAGNSDLFDRIVTGAFSEIMSRSDPARRHAWFGSYVNTILQRDIRDMAHIEGLTELPRMLSLLAARSATLLNSTEISRSAGMPLTTLRRYMTYLQTAFLIAQIPAWSTNVAKPMVRAPKVLLTDSGPACSLLKADRQRLQDQPELAGRLCESFVAMELVRELGWSRTSARLFHYRTHARREVDLVLEGPGGRVAGIEVKTSRSLGGDTTQGLRDLAEAAGKRFHKGVILYAGEQVVPFGRNLYAVPLDRLWRWWPRLTRAPARRSSPPHSAPRSRARLRRDCRAAATRHGDRRIGSCGCGGTARSAAFGLEGRVPRRDRRAAPHR